jgi:hypothetical protein
MIILRYQQREDLIRPHQTVTAAGAHVVRRGEPPALARSWTRLSGVSPSAWCPPRHDLGGGDGLRLDWPSG